MGCSPGRDALGLGKLLPFAKALSWVMFCSWYLFGDLVPEPRSVLVARKTPREVNTHDFFQLNEFYSACASHPLLTYRNKGLLCLAFCLFWSGLMFVASAFKL